MIKVDQLATVDHVLAQFQDVPGALLPVLHGVQKNLGYIPDNLVAHIADGLNLSRAEVHGVISFYHYFRTTPPGKHIIQICRAEACQSMGCVRLEQHVTKTLGVDYHGTTRDGKFTLEPVYCLGNCAASPSIMIDEQIYGRVSPDSFAELIKNCE